MGGELFGLFEKYGELFTFETPIICGFTTPDPVRTLYAPPN
jgi:hypothetical protein